MNLEDQVASLELSKRLKELAVKQESYFKWEERENGQVELYHSKATSITHKYYSAFTVAELGELLPVGYTSARIISATKKDPIFKKYWICFSDSLLMNDIVDLHLTEADARAQALIYLLENKLTNINEYI